MITIPLKGKSCGSIAQLKKKQNLKRKQKHHFKVTLFLFTTVHVHNIVLPQTNDTLNS